MYMNRGLRRTLSSFNIHLLNPPGIRTPSVSTHWEIRSWSGGDQLLGLPLGWRDSESLALHYIAIKLRWGHTRNTNTWQTNSWPKKQFSSLAIKAEPGKTNLSVIHSRIWPNRRLNHVCSGQLGTSKIPVDESRCILSIVLDKQEAVNGGSQKRRLWLQSWQKASRPDDVRLWNLLKKREQTWCCSDLPCVAWNIMQILM